jgi:hypothetical protein
MEKYYVYCHKNPTTNEIFYVGKGSGYRAYVTQSRGKFWYDYVKKHGIPIVEILHENLSEDESFILEKELIKTFGRRDINNGLLVNTTDGGEGCGGMTHSDKSKKKMSINKQDAFKKGALLGLLMYGTFDITNKTIFKDYTWEYAIKDTLWGTFAMGLTSYIAYSLSI